MREQVFLFCVLGVLLTALIIPMIASDRTLGRCLQCAEKSSGGLSIAPAMAECTHSKPWCSQTGLEPASPTRCALGVRHGLTADKALLAWRSPNLSYGRSIPKLTTSRRKCAPVSKRAYGCFHRKANFPTEKRPLRRPTCSAAHLGQCGGLKHSENSANRLSASSYSSGLPFQIFGFAGPT